MSTTTIHTVGEEQTVALGRRLGTLANPGDVFLLSGELGTGKTCLVRGVAAGLGASDCASSPSFVIIREYRGRLTLYHMDFYRLERPEEIADLGIEEYLYGGGICAVEWAERAAGLLPEEHLGLTLSYASGEGERDIVVTSAGSRYDAVVAALQNAPRDVC
jgi:tRNA threonylcarbamoyladenosine biosynthesis protein TsaE